MRFLTDFEPLLPAERKLLKHAVAGETCWLTTEGRPTGPTDATEVRASFVRFLALGGDPSGVFEGRSAAVHDSGIRLRGAYIKGAVNLDGANKVRPLWLIECVIAGRFSIADARTKVICLDKSSIQSLRGEGVKIDGSLLLRNTICEGDLKLFGAEIDSTLACAGATIKGVEGSAQRLAVDLATATIRGNVEFKRGFTAHGLIGMDDAEIGGLFDCSDGRFLSTPQNTGPAPSYGRDVNLRALKCHRLLVGGSLYLRGSQCDGEISFSGAEIGGDLDCREGRFETQNGDRIALRFTRIKVGGNVYLSDRFQSFGKVQFNGAAISGNLDCRGGTFTIPQEIASKDFAGSGDRFSQDALSLVNAEIRGALILAPIEPNDNSRPATFYGSIDLKSAKAQALVDNLNAWPQGVLHGGSNQLRDVIHLDGFTYERFAGTAPTDARSRKRWLLCQTASHLGRDFKPQPFEQVIKVLKAMGHPEDAKRLAIERQHYQNRRQLRNWGNPFRVLAALITRLTAGLLIGYGYRPQRALLLMLLVGLAGGAYIRIAAEQGIFAPRDPQMFLAPGFERCRPGAKLEEGQKGGNWTRCADPDWGVGIAFAEYPQFNPWIYSFDVLLPVFDLRQEVHWVPMQRPVTLDVAYIGRITFSPHGTTTILLLERIFGWVGSLLIVGAFSGLVKTD